MNACPKKKRNLEKIRNDQLQSFDFGKNKKIGLC